MIDLCPVCTQSSLQDILTVTNVPVHQNLLYDTRNDALNTRRGTIQLAICAHCGFVTNRTFDLSLLDYSEKYENTQNFSNYFQAYVNALVAHLIDSHELVEKTIVEIGCGKGDFIKALVAQNDNVGFGFDPSYLGDLHLYDGRLTFIQDFYDGRYREYRADLYTSRHVIEHIPEPLAHIQVIRESIGDRQASVFFETPDVSWIFQHAAFWDLAYEHCSLFSPDSMRHLLQLGGFKHIDVVPAFGDQYMWTEAKSAAEITLTPHERVERLVQSALAFGKQFSEVKYVWRQKIDVLLNQGKQVAIWGAGAKGVNFLNMLEFTSDAISHVVDVNPRKQGKYIAGTGQQIILPSQLSQHKPDTVVIMNPNYQDEIRTQLADIAPEAQVIVL